LIIFPTTIYSWKGRALYTKMVSQLFGKFEEGKSLLQNQLEVGMKTITAACLK